MMTNNEMILTAFMAGLCVGAFVMLVILVFIISR